MISRFSTVRLWENCLKATKDIDRVYNLRADMGGIGYITLTRYISRNNILINTHMLDASRLHGDGASCSRRRPAGIRNPKQKDPDVTPVEGSDAIPADPEPWLGWRSCLRRAVPLLQRKTRFGDAHRSLSQRLRSAGTTMAARRRLRQPSRQGGTRGGRRRHRSLGDASNPVFHVRGRLRGRLGPLMAAIARTAKLGHDRLVTINELINLVSDVAGKKLKKRHDLSKPQGAARAGTATTRY